MNPATSERNLTPTSIDWVSGSVMTAGAAVALQMLPGQLGPCAWPLDAVPGSNTPSATSPATKRCRLILDRAKISREPISGLPRRAARSGFLVAESNDVGLLRAARKQRHYLVGVSVGV